MSWGSTVAALGLGRRIRRILWYVATFDSYNRIYGSLGAGLVS